MIIQRKYVTFKRLYENDPYAEKAIDRGIFIPGSDSAEMEIIKQKNVENNNALYNLDMSCGIPRPNYIKDDFKDLDQAHPFDNGFEYKDATHSEIVYTDYEDVLCIFLFTQENEVVSVEYVGNPAHIDEIKKEEEQETKDYIYFWHEYESYGYFSNSFITSFILNDFLFQHVEQYIMAQKAKLFHDAENYTNILRCSSPADCKEYGRKISPFNEEVWDRCKENIMKEGIRAKFEQNSKLMLQLMDTGNSYLVYADPKDKVWGIGMEEKDARHTSLDTWPGQNLLGNILMELRQEFHDK